MNEANNISNGLEVSTQLPLDGKTYFKTLAELIDLGTSNANAYKYYHGMTAYLKEDGKEYQWRNKVGAEVGKLPTDFTYPAGSVVNGIDYSAIAYNFFEKGSGAINQDNLILEVIVPTQNSIADIVTAFNSLPDFTVSDIQRVIVRSKLPNSDVRLFLKKGKGNYGTTNPPTILADFISFVDTQGQFVSFDDIEALKTAPLASVGIGTMVHVKKYDSVLKDYVDNFYIIKSTASATTDGDVIDEHAVGITLSTGAKAILMDKDRLTANAFGVTGSSATNNLFSGTSFLAMADASMKHGITIPAGTYTETTSGPQVVNSFNFNFNSLSKISHVIPAGIANFLTLTIAGGQRFFNIDGFPSLNVTRATGATSTLAFSITKDWSGKMNLKELTGHGGIYVQGNGEKIELNIGKFEVERGLLAAVYNYGKDLTIKCDTLNCLNTIFPQAGMGAIRTKQGSTGFKSITRIKANRITSKGGPTIFCENNTITYIDCDVLESLTANQKSIVAAGNSEVHIRANKIIGTMEFSSTSNIHIYGNPRIETTETNAIQGNNSALKIHGSIFPNKPVLATIKYGTLTVVV